MTYRITKDQQEMWRALETPDHLHQGGEQMTVERLIPLGSLTPGRYAIEVTAIDLLTNATVIRSADFTVKGVAPTNTGKSAFAKLGINRYPDRDDLKQSKTTVLRSEVENVRAIP